MGNLNRMLKSMIANVRLQVGHVPRLAAQQVSRHSGDVMTWVISKGQSAEIPGMKGAELAFVTRVVFSYSLPADARSQRVADDLVSPLHVQAAEADVHLRVRRREVLARLQVAQCDVRPEQPVLAAVEVLQPRAQLADPRDVGGTNAGTFPSLPSPGSNESTRAGTRSAGGPGRRPA